MIPDILLNNLVPWAVQVLVIGSIGALLPLGLRIRHPRSQLVYCHVLLVGCVVLPVIQPWQHPVIFSSNAQGNAAVVATLSTTTSIYKTVKVGGGVAWGRWG